MSKEESIPMHPWASEGGGPALPFSSNGHEFKGMSLRDYLAAKAMKSFPGNLHDHEKCAKWCYERASAMLAERDKQDG